MSKRARPAAARERAQAAPVGGLVRQARLAAGLTQAELAGAEMTKALISHIERGRVRPSLRTLHVIAPRLGRDVHEFLDEADPQVRQKRVAADLLASEAAASQGRWDEVELRTKAALRMDPPHGQRMTLLRLQSWAEVEGGRFEAALDLTDHLFREADPDADAFEIMQAHHARGVAYGRTGDTHLAVQELERGREIMERAEVRDPAARGRLLVALGTAYRRSNRTAKAIATYEAALALGAQSEQLRVAAESFMGVGAALYDSGELEGAIANYARALELFERLSTVTYELSTLQSLAAVTFESGDLTKARELAERCKARAIAAGVPKAVATADLTLARLAQSEGDREGALRIASGAAAALAGVDNTQRADALTIIGSVHEALGNTAEADRAYNEAIAALTKTGVGPAYAQVTTEYAEILSKRGESARAYELLKTTLVERLRTPAAPPKRRARARGK